MVDGRFDGDICIHVSDRYILGGSMLHDAGWWYNMYVCSTGSEQAVMRTSRQHHDVETIVQAPNTVPASVAPSNRRVLHKLEVRTISLYTEGSSRNNNNRMVSYTRKLRYV